MARLSPFAGSEEALHAIFRAAGREEKGRGRPGDDCAWLRPPVGSALAWTCDQVALGVHARRGTPPEALAVKLLRRSLSDLAAAGACPWALAWTIAAPARTPPRFLERLARAFLREARRFRVPVVGGDCTRAGALVLSCSALGVTERRGPGRSGARPGDELWVTGRLGDAVRSGRHLRPQPRLREGACLLWRHRAHAVMDLSDGLARDLPRLLRRSRVGAKVDVDALPLARTLRGRSAAWLSALCEGEDYELLAALAPAAARRAARDPLLRRAGFTRIGSVTAARDLRWLHGGRAVRLPRGGYEHRWGTAR